MTQIHTGNTDQFKNCISGTMKVSKYIANLAGLTVLKKSGTNLSNTRDPQKHTANADQLILEH